MVGGAFGFGGDSGSLKVDATSLAAVGLMFATDGGGLDQSDHRRFPMIWKLRHGLQTRLDELLHRRFKDSYNGI